MISKKMQDSLNEQIKNEIYSAYLYLSMSAYCDSIDLKGFASWMRVQYQEEMFHAFKMYDYILEQDGQVQLLAIDQPPYDFESPEKVFQATLEHERKVTAIINNLMDLALEEKDHASNIFLQWFITEQIEEESTAKRILQEIKMAGVHPQGLFMIDRELGQRVYTPPATAE
jgi:ferritin